MNLSRPIKTFRHRPAFVQGLGIAGVLVLALLVGYFVLTVVAVSSSPDPATDQQLAASQESAGGQRFASDGTVVSGPPRDTALSLTIPKMDRADHIPVKSGGVSDDQALKQGALHVEGTGFPLGTWRQHLHSRTPARLPRHKEPPALLGPGRAL